MVSVEEAVWLASASNTITLPLINSHVYYFTQGHFEQSTKSSFQNISNNMRAVIHCRVTNISFLANPETDEVFAKIKLMPCNNNSNSNSNSNSLYGQNLNNFSGKKLNKNVLDGEKKEKEVESFSKVLTQSDANNGGGFSVPRYCADIIFPPLDFNADPPVQNITIRDMHGVGWEFRHIYRGTPRRHLLTTGWSKFVNHKKLVAGDSVVFMRTNKTGVLSVGIRRAVRCNSDFRSRVTPESVAEAAELAAKGLGFEVVYYPRVGWGGFVVEAEKVEESMNMFWTVGMKVKISLETEDSSRSTWFQGTVSEAVVPDKGPWKGSPWKMLEVEWDEPEYLQHLKRVSPWQVEYVMAPSPPHSVLHPAKKFRTTPNPELRTDEGHDLSYPITGLSDSLIGNFSPSMMTYYSLPAGMQGARQSPFFSSLSNLICEDTNQICGQNIFGNNISPKMKTVPTELNIQSSPSEILSPDSQNSVYLFGTEIVGKQGCVSPKNSVLSSFQLFGKTIHVKSVESNSDDTACTEGNGIALLEEAESLKESMNLLDGIDVQKGKGTRC